MPSTPRRQDPRAAATLFAAVFLAFLPALFGDFLLDDFFYIVGNETLRRPALWPRFFYDSHSLFADAGPSAAPYFRPVAGLSYALNRLLGESAFWFHLHDAALHAANACLVYRLVSDRGASGPRAWAAAALFALHPAQAQSAAYISARAGSLALFFTLLSLLTYSSPRRARWSWAAFSLALLSKESSLAFLAVLPAYDWVYGARGEPWRSRLRRWAPYAALGAAFLLCRTAVLGHLTGQPPWGGSWALHAQLALHGMFEYLYMLFWPSALREPYGYVPGPGFLAEAAGMAAAWACLGAAAAWGLWRRREWGFWGFWVLVFLAPVSNAIPFQALAADRFLYASMPGAAALAAGLLPRALRAPGPLLAGALFLWPFSAAQQLHWRSDFVLALEACEAAPGEPHAALRLATLYGNWGMLARAEALIQPSLAPGVLPEVRNLGLKRLAQARRRALRSRASRARPARRAPGPRQGRS